jgi:hypothetical protein
LSLDLYEELTELLGDLEAAGISYAVAGALALAIHGVPRATADIDLLIEPAAVDRALAVARRRGFDVLAAPMRFQDGLELRRSTKLAGEDALTLDLLLVNEGLREVFAGREQVAGERGGLWVVSREGLLRMKASAGRDQDLADIQRLRDADR